jgi:hypothetical protein
MRPIITANVVVPPTRKSGRHARQLRIRPHGAADLGMCTRTRDQLRESFHQVLKEIRELWQSPNGEQTRAPIW